MTPPNQPGLGTVLKLFFRDPIGAIRGGFEDPIGNAIEGLDLLRDEAVDVATAAVAAVPSVAASVGTGVKNVAGGVGETIGSFSAGLVRPVFREFKLVILAVVIGGVIFLGFKFRVFAKARG